MGKNLNSVQSYLDTNSSIPEKILRNMTREELAAFHRMEFFRENLVEVLDNEIETSPLHFSSTAAKRKNHVLKPFLVLPAAALFCIVVGFPLYHTLQLQKNTRELVREDTRTFVTALTGSNSWWENTVDDNTSASDWFNAEPIIIKDSF